MKKKCLLCYEQVEESENEFHKKCSRKLFLKPEAPALELTLNNIEALAKEHVNERFAVTGVQAKLSVSLKPSKQNALHPTQQHRLTVGVGDRYLLKAPTPKYPNIVELEDLSMHLAKICGIKTAQHGLIRLASGELAYITRRFDRDSKGKLAQEDLCQLSGLLTEHKYNSSMEKVGKVIKSFSMDPGLDARMFFEIAVFSFLIGNADMHTKNFSIHTSRQGLTVLSPAYDLLNTSFLSPDDEEEMALTINGKKSKIKKDDFLGLAKNLEINEIATSNSFKKFSKVKERMLAFVTMGFISKSLAKDLKELINSRYARLEI